MSAGFDVDRYRRKMSARHRTENGHLHAHVAHLEQVLALVLRCAAHGRDFGPLKLLAVIEDVVDTVDREQVEERERLAAMETAS